MDVCLIDMADFSAGPRDKTCGDGLTPRATHALQELGLDSILTGRPHIRGLKLHGFGGSVTAPWPNSPVFPPRGSAIPRFELDATLWRRAVSAGARFLGGVKILTAVETTNAIELTGRDATGSTVTVSASRLLLAEGVRSTVAKQLGSTWLRGMVHGVAARSYVATTRADEPWIHSHLELTDAEGHNQPGYGWVFPLGSGTVTPPGAPDLPPGATGWANLGCGALSTQQRPAKVNTKKLLHHYATQIANEWGLVGAPQVVTSALLPMGGAVTKVAGRRWMAIGDTAALVNPLNGEGIDYALESAQLAVDLLLEHRNTPSPDFEKPWSAELQRHYGHAFSLARRLAVLLTMPKLLNAAGGVVMGGPVAGPMMGVAARLMGNLVTPEDEDLTARIWRAAGALSAAADRRAQREARPLFGAS